MDSKAERKAGEEMNFDPLEFNCRFNNNDETFRAFLDAVRRGEKPSPIARWFMEVTGISFATAKRVNPVIKLAFYNLPDMPVTLWTN